MEEEMGTGGIRGGEREGGRGEGGIKVRAGKQLTHTAGWIMATFPPNTTTRSNLSIVCQAGTLWKRQHRGRD